MTIEFWNFSKKKNSTKQPSAGSGTQFTGVELKNDTSILNPVILIRTASLPVPTVAPSTVFTYAYIAKFTRYYFVTDWVYVAGIWECHLSIDVLASHKVMIGATSAYIERSASAYNGSIIDKIYPATTDYDIQYSATECAYYNIAPSGGTYVVGIINASANTAGAITYYAMNQSQLMGLLSYMFGNDIWNTSGITEVSQGLFKSMFNPIQYISSCTWFPFPIATFGTTDTTVYLGYYNTGVTAKAVVSLAHQAYIYGDVPSHPQASTRGDYLNYAPYTDVTLYFPPFGSIPIDTAFLKEGRHIYCPYWVDHITGEAMIRVSVSPSHQSTTDFNICAERTAKIGVSIQLSQVLADYSHSINTLQSGISGGLVGAVMGALGATVQSALDSKFPSVSSSGCNGGFMEVLPPCTIVTKFTKIVNGDNTDLGRPLMDVRTINTLSGFIKCGEAHFSAPCFDSERDQIEQMMLTGFFYE